MTGQTSGIWIMLDNSPRGLQEPKEVNYTDDYATSVPTLSLQETWLYRLPTVECGSTTQIPRSTCPSVTI